MASQDSEQPEIQPSGQDLRNHEPTLPDCIDYDFSDLHLPDGDFLDQHLLPASGFLSPENHSGLEALVQSSPGRSDDLRDELLGEPATEPFDDLRDELSGLSTAEFSDDLGDEQLDQLAFEPSEPPDDLKDELLGQPMIEPFDRAVTSSSPDSGYLEETQEDWIRTLTDMIRQMMFVSGETSEASVETTTIIEEIVHTQVTEIVGVTS